MTAPADRDILRRLAGDVAELARGTDQQVRKKRWEQLNDLHPERPMLWITEIPWEEFEEQFDALRPVLRDPVLGTVERKLRRVLFTARHLPCDEVIEPVWWLPMDCSGTGWGVALKEETRRQGKTRIHSHHFKPVISTLDDLEKIPWPDVRYNEERTLEKKEVLESMFGDLLEVVIHGPRQHWFNAWDLLVRWTGVMEAFTALVDQPEFVHAFMRRMTDVMLMRMDQLESRGLLGYPHPLPRVGSGGAGYSGALPRPDHDPAHIRTRDQWGGATAQIFGEVSPEMHAEFALQYEIEVMSRCGLNYYGCCEALHHKMELMAQIPRLRKLSISPWCHVRHAAAAAQRLGRTYVFSHKPNPACFAGEHYDGAQAEQELRQRLADSGDMPCEIVMKDISTVRGDVRRLKAWCAMAWRVVNDA